MVYFQTKNPHLGKFWRVFQWEMLVYFIAVWSILRAIGIFVANWYFYCHLVYFFPFWYVEERKIWQPCFGCGLSVSNSVSMLR
jgi:hypothetical protein